MRFSVIVLSTLLAAALPGLSAPVPSAGLPDVIPSTYGESNEHPSDALMGGTPDKRAVDIDDPLLFHIIYTNPPGVVGGEGSGSPKGPPDAAGKSQEPGDGVVGSQ
ncbi:hypothetical protein BC835DRAFT_1414476 [Cytidiella melzeri]|nr:hypothetical protein BC835DRAFT_1414476 [Cytidiella melzeri]